MRLVTYIPASSARSEARLGVLTGSTVVDPLRVLHAEQYMSSGEAALVRAPEVPTEMVAFFEGGEVARRLAERASEVAARAAEHGDVLKDAEGRRAVFDLREVELLAPVPRPRRIRDYLTYFDHATGSGLSVPAAFAAMPICYECNVETVVGPEEPLLWPSYTAQLDFELELGFFTSGGGRDWSPAEAASRIAGVTIFNDVSARDIQFYEMTMGIGPSKGKAFCNAMGPCVLTMDEVDEWSVEMTASVNGELWSSGTTRHRQFSFAEVLAWASLAETVYPGEFFAVGTVGGGCGLELDRWIQPGDVVSLEASGVGVLRNPVAPRADPPAGSGLSTYRGAPEVHRHHES
ncbi:fumarylacetoacetate hydrolase family protein [Amycolatopsis rhizosphaerae]|uniref:Fumarylacetoacetate hydrolase family protein n=1 Tax=Amycolatopsis rhizosphaerae TaxID=2053003 RepID=A0A558D6V8_9PSEU|nr:fumarylacetoacetate hydrolase family protein [Amycolatopsis rhizosphaerae]